MVVDGAEAAGTQPLGEPSEAKHSHTDQGAQRSGFAPLPMGWHAGRRRGGTVSQPSSSWLEGGTTTMERSRGRPGDEDEKLESTQRSRGKGHERLAGRLGLRVSSVGDGADGLERRVGRTKRGADGAGDWAQRPEAE